MEEKKTQREKMKKLEKEFREKNTAENSKRFVIFLGIIALWQAIMIVMEVLGYFEWNSAVTVTRAFVFGFLIFGSVLMIYLRKRFASRGKLDTLSIIQFFIQLVILAYSFVYTVYMFIAGFESFTVIMIMVLIITLSQTRWPYIMSALFCVAYAALLVHITINYDIKEFFIEEAHLAILFMVLAAFANVIIYKRSWKFFLQEKEITKINNKLTKISQADELTGLFNRRKMIEELEQNIEKSNNGGNAFCVVMVDLDHFKKVNDKYGHNIGDNTLKEFVEVISKNLRKTDTFGRWGGEEFVMIISDSDKDDAYSFVDRLRKVVAKHRFKDVGRMTFSAGICEFSSEYNDDKLIGNADFALYISKQMGRNKVSVFAA